MGATTPLSQIARLEGESLTHRRARTFTQIARCFALGGSIGDARREADKLGLAAAGAIIKAVTAASTIDQLGEYQALASAWISTLKNIASGAILAASVSVPRMTRVGLITQIEASGVAEGAAKSVHSLELTPD